MIKPYYEDDLTTIYNGDAVEVLKEIQAADLILTDPPYFKVKKLEWDNQWGDAKEFIDWMDLSLKEFERILAANGSLYLFASPKMAARVEVLIGKRFEVLNRIRWTKDAGWHKKAQQTALRSFLSPWEEIIFAEHYGADNMAKGEAGYAAKCDELRGFVFEPLRAYIADEWKRAGLTKKDADLATGTQMASHYLTRSQWALPTEANYEKLRAYANRNDNEYLRREYEYLRREYEYLRREYEELRREYEELRREYEELRRPFSVTADVPFTDVWTFPTVKSYKGKHPCEKPAELLEHIIQVSSRDDDIILDPFMGSGSTLLAARKLGRKSIGIEMDEEWCEKVSQRLCKPS
jgi:adenine-specific DNA-methyltransferase